jgi:hypothetical protein
VDALLDAKPSRDERVLRLLASGPGFHWRPEDEGHVLSMMLIYLGVFMITCFVGIVVIPRFDARSPPTMPQSEAAHAGSVTMSRGAWDGVGAPRRCRDRLVAKAGEASAHVDNGPAVPFDLDPPRRDVDEENSEDESRAGRRDIRLALTPCRLRSAQRHLLWPTDEPQARTTRRTGLGTLVDGEVS